MDTKNKPNLLQLHSFNKAVFNTGGAPRELTLLELMKLSQMINSHLKACSEMIHYLQYYKDFESNLEEVLKDSFREDDNEYSIGASFPMFMDDVKNNDQAAEIIKKEFKEEHGENTLIFDPEHSHCYVYTKNKEEARKFLLFTYNKYIKPTLEPWYEGFDEFMKEFLAAPKEERNQFVFLGN